MTLVIIIPIPVLNLDKQYLLELIMALAAEVWVVGSTAKPPNG